MGAFDDAWDSAPEGNANSFDAAWGSPAQAVPAIKPPEKSFLRKSWEDVKSFPGAAYEAVTSIPQGLSNLNDLPGELGNVGVDAFNILRSKIFNKAYAPKADYARIDRTLKGIGELGAATAGAIGGPLGMSAASRGYHWLLQSVGAEDPITPKQDADLLRRGTIHNALFSLGLKTAGKTAETISAKSSDVASALDRKSIGTRSSDYGGKNTTQTIETPEGGIETRVKSMVDDLLENGKLGASRDPATLNQVVRDASKNLNDQIANKIKNYDEVAPETGARINPPVEPKFPNAQKFINENVPADEVPTYQRKLDRFAQAVQERGNGNLSYLQKQKVALGKSYDLMNKVKSGYQRALYRDLKSSIEEYAPEVKSLNAELAKYIVADPIIKRGLRAEEAASPLSWVSQIQHTTGGAGLPTAVGAILGGPQGAVVGGLLGVGSKLLAGPTGQALTARVLRNVSGLSGGAAKVLTPASDLIGFKRPVELARGLLRGNSNKGGGGGSGGGQPLDLGAEGSIFRPSQSTAMGAAVSPSGPMALTRPLMEETAKTLPSYKYSPATSAKDILGDSDFIAHYNNTIKKLPELENILKGAAGDYPIKSNVKDINVAAEKITRKIADGKLDYNEKSLGDIIRGQITAPNSEAALSVLNKLRSSKSIVGNVENNLKNPNAWGYQGINVNVKTKSGALAEVQIHTPQSIAIQDAIHSTYEKFRNQKAPSEVELLKALEESRDLAAEALLKSKGKDIYNPGDPALEKKLLEQGGQVKRVQREQIALRPKEMQYRTNVNEKGVREENAIHGPWDEGKAGVNILWEPKNKSEYGLSKNEKYILVDGHHRLVGADERGVTSHNSIVKREADGVSISDAKAYGAEVNIAQGRSTVYDTAKFLREYSKKFGEEKALEVAKRLKPNAIRQGKSIGLDATSDLYTAFTQGPDRPGGIAPEDAYIIASMAPKNQKIQQVGIKAVINDGLTGDKLKSAILAEQVVYKPKQIGSIDEDIWTLAKRDAIDDLIKGLKDRKEGLSVQNKADKANKTGLIKVDVSQEAKSSLDSVNSEIQSWKKWLEDPAKIKQVGLKAQEIYERLVKESSNNPKQEGLF